jgi:hypothetical protein
MGPGEIAGTLVRLADDIDRVAGELPADVNEREILRGFAAGIRALYRDDSRRAPRVSVLREPRTRV